MSDVDEPIVRLDWEHRTVEGDAVDWDLLADPDSPAGLAAPVIDGGTRKLIRKLVEGQTELARMVDQVRRRLSDGQVRTIAEIQNWPTVEARFPEGEAVPVTGQVTVDGVVGLAGPVEARLTSDGQPVPITGRVIVDNPAAAPERGLAKDDSIRALAAAVGRLTTPDEVQRVAGMVGLTPDALSELVSALRRGVARDQVEITGGQVGVAGAVTVRGPVSQSGPWSMSLDPPSAVKSRTAVHAQVANRTASTDVHTVTSGKTLYVTTLVFSAAETSTLAFADVRIQDNSTVKVPIIVQSAGRAVLAVTFPEPLQFSAKVRAELASGAARFSCSVTGYEA